MVDKWGILSILAALAGVLIIFFNHLMGGPWTISTVGGVGAMIVSVILGRMSKRGAPTQVPPQTPPAA